MRAVLIIENDEYDFNSIRKKFINADWSILPNTFEELERLYSQEHKKELEGAIKNLIMDNHQNIGMIILDINLFGKNFEDKYGLDAILKLIRTTTIKENPLWSAQVPIIAYSKFDDFETRDNALSNKYHVHSFISKNWGEDNTEELLLTAEALYAVYAMNLNIGGFEDHSNFYFDKMKKLMVVNQEAIEARLEKINVIFEGKFDDIRDHLELILNDTLIGLCHRNKQGEFINEFMLETGKALGENQLMTFNMEFNRRDVKEQLEICLKHQNFSKFIDIVFKKIEELGDTGIIDSLTEDKVIGTAFSAIAKTLSK